MLIIHEISDLFNRNFEILLLFIFMTLMSLTS